MTREQINALIAFVDARLVQQRAYTVDSMDMQMGQLPWHIEREQREADRRMADAEAALWATLLDVQPAAPAGDSDAA